MNVPITISAIVCFSAFMALIAIAGGDAAYECQTYNEMRAIWDESGHEYGWPEYEPGKDEECGYES